MSEPSAPTTQHKDIKLGIRVTEMCLIYSWCHEALTLRMMKRTRPCRGDGSEQLALLMVCVQPFSENRHENSLTRSLLG